MTNNDGGAVSAMEKDPANELERQLAVIYCRLNTWRRPITGEGMSAEESDYARDRISNDNFIFNVQKLAPHAVLQRIWMAGSDAWTNIPRTSGNSSISFDADIARLEQVRAALPNGVKDMGRDHFLMMQDCIFLMGFIDRLWKEYATVRGQLDEAKAREHNAIRYEWLRKNWLHVVTETNIASDGSTRIAMRIIRSTVLRGVKFDEQSLDRAVDAAMLEKDNG